MHFQYQTVISLDAQAYIFGSDTGCTPALTFRSLRFAILF